MREKLTKYQVIIDFINELKSIVSNINDNSVSKNDYFKLREYFMMVGIEEEMIDSIYTKCGFEDANDFYNQRKLNKQYQSGNVSCSISKINGLCEAVVEYLECEIAKKVSKQ